MKTRKNLLGILLLMAIVVCIAFGCKTIPEMTSDPSIVSSGTSAHVVAEHVEKDIDLTGTYTYGSNFTITFNSGNRFTARVINTTYSGTYLVSGNTFTLTDHGSSSNWINGTWTIVDENTLRDADGDLWRNQSATPSTLSGNYYIQGDLSFFNMSINFNGNNFALMLFDTEIVSGSYSVSGSAITLTGHGSTENYLTGIWAIVDSNTLRDPDGDLWERR